MKDRSLGLRLGRGFARRRNRLLGPRVQDLGCRIVGQVVLAQQVVGERRAGGDRPGDAEPTSSRGGSQTMAAPDRRLMMICSRTPYEAGLGVNIDQSWPIPSQRTMPAKGSVAIRPKVPTEWRHPQATKRYATMNASMSGRVSQPGSASA